MNEVQADILEITWQGGNNQATASTSSQGFVDMDQVDGTNAFGDLFVQNYLGSYCTTTSFKDCSTFDARMMYANNFEGFKLEPVLKGDVVSAGNIGATNFARENPFSSATSFIVFRTTDNNVGWFRLETEQFPGNVRLMGGQVATNGEALTVGGSGILAGDMNCDGTVDLLDVAGFVDALSSSEFNIKADVDLNGVVDLLDVDPFVALLSSGG